MKMKILAEKIKSAIFAVLLLLCVASCTHDDIKEIFIDREWTLTYILREDSVQYDNRGKKYKVIFTDEEFNAIMPGGSAITGKWKADNKSRSFQCWGIKTTGSLRGDTIGEKMLNIFTNAKSYEGDTNWLQIKQQKNTYMQFYSR